MKFYIPKIEILLDQDIPIGTVFDMIIASPRKYADNDLAKRIKNNQQSYQEFVIELKRGYVEHLSGTKILNTLSSMGFPESFIVKYVLYPKTYQFRTHLPFIEQIVEINNFPKSTFCSSPIIEEFLGLIEVREGSLVFPVVRYAIPGGGTEFGETPKDICGTFYYPETDSDVILKFNSCLIVPNKIVAYNYLFNVNVDDIALVFLGKSDLYSEILHWGTKRGCGFANYTIAWDFNERDTSFVYDAIKSDLTKSLDEIINLVLNSSLPYNPQSYFQDLKLVIDDDVSYTFRDEVQDKDMLLFAASYMKYTAIKMMIAGTWNWRVSIDDPYTAFDQKICLKAEELNIDVIILVTEASTGMYSIRSEIVDTRSRDDSYDNLRIRCGLNKVRDYEINEMYESF